MFIDNLKNLNKYLLCKGNCGTIFFGIGKINIE